MKLCIISRPVIYSQMTCCPEWDDKNVLDQVTVQVVLFYPVRLLQQMSWQMHRHVSRDICFLLY